MLIKNLFRHEFTLLLIVLTLIGCGGTSSPSPISLDSYTQKPTLRILGVTNQISDKPEWQNLKIGFGLQNQLLDLAFDSKQFQFKEYTPEIQTKLKEIQSTMWQDNQFLPPQNFLSESADFDAWIEIQDHYRNRDRAAVGVAMTTQINTIVVLTIHIRENSTGIVWTSQGEGKASTKANSFVFTFQEGNQKFAQSEAALATQEALKNAWQQFEFHQK